jgi:hypothetical protein
MQDFEILVARADAATRQAKQLMETLVASQELTRKQVAERQLQRFIPAGWKIRYPQDFPEQERAWQPFPIPTDEI